MTQREFEERTGKTVTMEEFEHINGIYMMVEMDKDEFCKEWKRMGTTQRMVDELASYANKLVDELGKLHRQEDELKQRIAQLESEADTKEADTEEADTEEEWIGRALSRLQEWKKEVKHSFVNKDCGSTMSEEDLFDAIQIVSTALNCKVQFNVPVRDNYSRTHDILILESNAAVVSKLHEAGFSLSMTDKGLRVTKY